MKLKKNVFLVIFLLLRQIVFCGFSPETLVRTCEGYAPIEQLGVGDNVVSSDLQGNHLEKKITQKQCNKQENCLCLIIGQEEIVTSQNQKFFLAGECIWKSAKDLRVGDILLDGNDDGVEINEIVKFEQTDLLEIAVEQHHIFFVSEGEFLVHNFAAAVAVGAAEVIAGIATGVAVVVGLKSSGDSGEFIAEKTKEVTRDSGKNVTDESEEIPRETGVQAPGKPREEDGFVPKKKSEAGKIKVQKGKLKGKAGWPDKKDNV